MHYNLKFSLPLKLNFPIEDFDCFKSSILKCLENLQDKELISVMKKSISKNIVPKFEIQMKSVHTMKIYSPISMIKNDYRILYLRQNKINLKKVAQERQIKN